MPDGPPALGFPHWSTPAGATSSHESPSGWEDLSNAGYVESAEPTSAALCGTEKLWPYEATPRTSLFAGKPASVQALTAETAEPCWFSGAAHESFSGALGPTDALQVPQRS